MSKHRDAHEAIQERMRFVDDHARLKDDMLRRLRQLHQNLEPPVLAAAIEAGVQRMARRSHDTIARSFEDLLWFNRRARGSLTELLSLIPCGGVTARFDCSDEAYNLLVALGFTLPLHRKALSAKLFEVEAFIARLEAADVSISQERWDPSLIVNREFRELLSPSAFHAAGMDLTDSLAIQWSAFARAGLSIEPDDDLWRDPVEGYGDEVLASLGRDESGDESFIVGIPLRTLFIRTFQGDLIEQEFGRHFAGDSADIQQRRWMEAVDRCLIRIGEVALDFPYGDAVTGGVDESAIEPVHLGSDGESDSLQVAGLDILVLGRLFDIHWQLLTTLWPASGTRISAEKLAERCGRSPRAIQDSKRQILEIHQAPLIDAVKGHNGGYWLTEAGEAAVSWHRSQR